MPSYSIAVAGCGPAGLAAALYLVRLGHRVVVVERFDRPAPVGSGLILQPTGLAVLADLGLADRILGLGARIDRMFGRSVPSDPSRPAKVVLDVRYDALGPGRFGLAVHRAALFDSLHGAAAERVSIETGFAVAGLDRAADRRPILVDGEGRRLGPFDLVVDALGARSPLRFATFGHDAFRPLAYGALWASLPWPTSGPFDAATLEQRYRRAGAMAGVMPSGRRGPSGRPEATLFWSLKPERYPDWKAAGLAAWKAEVERLWPETRPLLDAVTVPEQLTLARYGHHTLALPHGDRIVFVGDAAHATSPQLGQGANMALLDAAALGAAFRDGGALERVFAGYADRRRLHVRLYQGLSRVFTPFYQSDGALLPALRDVFFKPVSERAIGARLIGHLVAGTLADPLGRAGLRNVAQE